MFSSGKEKVALSVQTSGRKRTAQGGGGGGSALLYSYEVKKDKSSGIHTCLRMVRLSRIGLRQKTRKFTYKH